MSQASLRASQTYWLVRILTATGPAHMGSNAAQWTKAFDPSAIERAIQVGILHKRRMFLSVTDAGTLWLARRDATLAEPALALTDDAASAAVTAIRELLSHGDDGDELDVSLLERAAALALTATPPDDEAKRAEIVGAARLNAMRAVIAVVDDPRSEKTSDRGVTVPRSRLTALTTAVNAIPGWETAAL